MRPSADIEAAIDHHADTVWRVTALYFRQEQDRQDAFQEAFLKYALADATVFADDEHRKAWLIRVTRNVCCDALKSAARRQIPTEMDELLVGASAVSVDPLVQPGSVVADVVEALRSLSDPPRTPLYLSVCEGYTAPEIASLLDAPVNTVYSWIARGKQRLREALS